MDAENRPARNLKISFSPSAGKPVAAKPGKAFRFNAMRDLWSGMPNRAASRDEQIGTAERFGDRFAERRESVSLAWMNGAVVSVAQGLRHGCATRWIRRDGTVRFESHDSGGGGALDAAGDQAVGEEILSAAAYLSLVREEAAAEPGEPLDVRAQGHFYRQRVAHDREGKQVVDDRRGAWIEIRAVIPDGGMASQRLAAADMAGIGARRPAALVGRVLARRCREMAGARVKLSGDFPVVLAAGGCEAFLHEIGHGFEGALARGPWGGWEPGARVASAAITLVDDPAGAWDGRGRYRIDDEGVAPSRALLVERGRIAGRVRSCSTLADGTFASGTGHGRRASYRDLPLARMACTILEPGGDDPALIVSGTPRGVFVRSLGSGSMDPESGRVTLSVTEAFMIERGCITRPLAPSFLVGDVASMLAAIDAVGSDFAFDHGATNCVSSDQQLPVMVGLPTIRIGMIKVISP